jgi:hypothetical protein
MSAHGVQLNVGHTYLAKGEDFFEFETACTVDIDMGIACIGKALLVGSDCLAREEA